MGDMTYASADDVKAVGLRAQQACAVLRTLSRDQKDAGLHAIADALSTQADRIIEANSADVDVGQAAGAATASHFGLFSAASGGQLLASGALAASQSIAATNLVKFATGALTVTVD